jgi:hypothetical protein
MIVSNNLLTFGVELRMSDYLVDFVVPAVYVMGVLYVIPNGAQSLT